MQTDIFQTLGYQELVSSQLNQTINFLFENDQEFALACETEFLVFEPELPKDISDGFGETVLFILTGYTYETAQIEKSHFSFEAGFGEENFGALVTLPILAIKQIFVDEYPIMINICRPISIHEEINNSEINPNKSMEALLNNPENKKLLKNR